MAHELRGIWSWENEIVVGFTLGYMDISNPGMHAVDKKRHHVTALARSLDGGETWHVKAADIRTPMGKGVSAGEHTAEKAVAGDSAVSLMPPPRDIEFQHPNFATMCARDSISEGAKSWFYVSDDRCHSWRGRMRRRISVLSGSRLGLTTRFWGPKQCRLFLTGIVNELEGAVFCAATADADVTFNLRSFVGPEPDGFSIIPAGRGCREGYG